MNVTSVVFTRFTPDMSTTVPIPPLGGEKLVIVGTSLTTKSVEVVAVPPGVVEILAET